MTILADMLFNAYSTPDGAIADPNHPVYALVYLLRVLGGAQ